MAYKSYDELVAGFWRWAEEDPEGKRMAREQMEYSRGGERGGYDVSFNPGVIVLLELVTPQLAAELVRRCYDDSVGYEQVLGRTEVGRLDSTGISLSSGSVECLLRYIATTGKSYNDD